MPIFSYLAYPVPGAKEQLINDLAALDFCEVTPSENEEVLILVKDEIPDGTRVTIGMINDILNRKGFYVDWCTRYLKKLPDGPIGDNKLSTNDVMTRIRGEDLVDDFDGYCMDAFDG